MSAPTGSPTESGPSLRWSSRARSIGEIETELARIWSQPDLTIDADGDGVRDRHIAARTSVMNLVIIANRPELGERAAAIISMLTGRHPSRTLVVTSADPDGPSWLDARIQALCVLPGPGRPETCTEFIYLTAGGESGRHLHAIAAPLLIHDLPVTIWWPGDPPFRSPAAADVLEMADRLIVDGSSWSGDGLSRLAAMADLLAEPRRAITDFALTRQSRWREAIASVFDLPDLRPYVRHLRRIAVTYATHDESGAPGTANVLKPIYHVAWLASRLRLEPVKTLQPIAARTGRGSGLAGDAVTTGAVASARGVVPAAARGLAGTLRGPNGEVGVVVRPVLSELPAGTTLRVELLAARRGSELRVDVTAETETVMVHAYEDGVEILARPFLAPRRTEVELLAEAIEAVGRDDVAARAILMAAAITRPQPATKEP
jgi:hypothetical protein